MPKIFKIEIIVFTILMTFYAVYLTIGNGNRFIDNPKFVGFTVCFVVTVLSVTALLA